MKKLTAFTFLLIAFLSLKATHITNGNMYYHYNGQTTGGEHKYTITLVMYRDCQSSLVIFEPQIAIGIYKRNTNYQLIKSDSFYLKEEIRVTAQSTVKQSGSCLKRGVYEKEIILPAGSGEFLITYERCCRPVDVSSMVGDISAPFYAYIFTASQNNSPVPVQDIPVVISKNIKTTITFAHTDADGDSLSYRLVTALQGASSASDPLPVPPTSYNQVPFSAATYKNNFSGLFPLGQSPSYATLDSITGIATLFASTQGIYPISYEVSEFKGGALHNKHYREVFVYCVDQSGFLNTASLSAAAAPYFYPKSIAVNWNYTISGTILGIELQRSNDSATGWAGYKTLSTTAFNFNDTGVTYQTDYWYRIKVDTGGTAIYSNAAMAKLNSSRVGLTAMEAIASPTVYPNPAGKSLFINSAFSVNTITIRDYMGKQVLLDKTSPAEINVEALTPGIYFIEIETNKGISTQRFFKE